MCLIMLKACLKVERICYDILYCTNSCTELLVFAICVGVSLNPAIGIPVSLLFFFYCNDIVFRQKAAVIPPIITQSVPDTTSAVHFNLSDSLKPRETCKAVN